VVPFYVAAYLLLSVLVGLCGRHRRIGFVGFLILALLVTPLLGLMVVYCTAERRPRTLARL
jgi:hypothetical protein